MGKWKNGFRIIFPNRVFNHAWSVWRQLPSGSSISVNRMFIDICWLCRHLKTYWLNGGHILPMSGVCLRCLETEWVCTIWLTLLLFVLYNQWEKMQVDWMFLLHYLIILNSFTVCINAILWVEWMLVVFFTLLKTQYMCWKCCWDLETIFWIRRLSSPGYIVTLQDACEIVTHPSTNLARCWVSLLMQPSLNSYHIYMGEVTSQSPWSPYDHHFVGITRQNVLS